MITFQETLHKAENKCRTLYLSKFSKERFVTFRETQLKLMVFLLLLYLKSEQDKNHICHHFCRNLQYFFSSSYYVRKWLSVFSLILKQISLIFFLKHYIHVFYLLYCVLYLHVNTAKLYCLPTIYYSVSVNFRVLVTFNYNFQ